METFKVKAYGTEAASAPLEEMVINQPQGEKITNTNFTGTAYLQSQIALILFPLVT